MTLDDATDRDPDDESMTRRDAEGREAWVVEGDGALAVPLRDALRETSGDWDVHVFTTCSEASLAISRTPSAATLLVVGLGLGVDEGIRIVSLAHDRFPTLPILAVSSVDGGRALLAAIRAGARGYLRAGDPTISIGVGVERVLAGDHPVSPSVAGHLFELARPEGRPGGLISPPLSPRELELLRILGQGYTYQDAGQAMGISVHTARSLSKRIYVKLDCRSKGEALRTARRQGWL